MKLNTKSMLVSCTDTILFAVDYRNIVYILDNSSCYRISYCIDCNARHRWLNHIAMLT